MSNELLNILSNSNKDIDNQKLMDYISGKLSGQDKHDVEQWMLESNFENDAVEGLQTVKNKKDLDAYVAQLNKELNQYLQQKKNRREKRKMKEIPWSYLAILLVLVFIIITYLVLQRIPK